MYLKDFIYYGQNFLSVKIVSLRKKCQACSFSLKFTAVNPLYIDTPYKKSL